MPARAQHDDLIEFLDVANYANLVFAADVEDELTFEVVQIKDDIATEFFNMARTTANADTDRRLMRYSPGYTLLGTETAFLRLGDDPDSSRESVRAIYTALRDLSQLDVFTEDDDVINGLRFYAVVLSGEEEQAAVFIRAYSPRRELSRSRKLALIGEAGQYDRVEEPVFMFDRNFDCYFWGDYLYIRNTVSFQRIFDYFDALRERSDEIIDSVISRVPIANVDEFREACKGHQQMMSKLSQIAQKDYFDRVTLADIQRAIDEFELPVLFEGRGAGRALVFETAPDRRWLILKLLDDDFLGSVMTNLKYEVNSKSAM